MTATAIRDSTVRKITSRFPDCVCDYMEGYLINPCLYHAKRKKKTIFQKYRELRRAYRKHWKVLG